VSLAGAFLIGLSTLQVEFDFGVPQFRLLEHPVLIATAASIALVTARLRVGRGGALIAVGFFLGVRVLLAVGVAAFDRVDLHAPLYLGSAVLVEVVALVLGTERPLRFGVTSGVAIGTLGLAGEWAWSRAWTPIGWTADLLPEALLLGLAAAVGGGILGALAGGDLAGRTAETPKGALALGWIGVVGAIALALPMSADAAQSVDVVVAPVGNGEADLEVTLDPADAADGAAWFHVLTWQGSADGGPGGSALTDLVPTGDGTFRTASPVAISGSAKTLIRLQQGRQPAVRAGVPPRGRRDPGTGRAGGVRHPGPRGRQDRAPARGPDRPGRTRAGRLCRPHDDRRGVAGRHHVGPPPTRWSAVVTRDLDPVAGAPARPDLTSSGQGKRT
jgi:hypothetical protein